MAKIDKLIQHAKKHLEEGEEILASVMGAYETKMLGNNAMKNGVFIATKSRIVFFGKRLTGYDLESFPYSNISSIEMGKNLMGHHISFFASGNKIKMKWINAGDIDSFISLVKSNIGSKSGMENRQLSCPADEIKKYAELRDQGIITEEEFNAKKKQLLGI